MYLFTGETPGNFHIIIENDDLEKAYETLRTFILTNLNPQHKTGESNVLILTCVSHLFVTSLLTRVFLLQSMHAKTLRLYKSV